MPILKEQCMGLLERKHQLENDINKLLVDFYHETGIMPMTFKFYTESNKFGNITEIVDTYVKITLDI